MELHIRGLLVSLLFHASLISLLLLLPFFYNYPCPPIDIHTYVSSTEINFPPDNTTQFHFRFLINSNAGNSTALDPTFAFDSKNNSRPETCQPANDILFSLVFLLLISYIFHFLEFWHNNTWIELRSAMEWTDVHKLLGNYSRASPVVWWRIVTYRRKMRWKLDKILPKRLVDVLTKSKIGANNFKPLLLEPASPSTSQASQVFSVQQVTKWSNHSNSLAFDIPLPHSVQPSSHTCTSMHQGIKVRSALISSPGSILMTSSSSSLSSSTLQITSSLSSSSSSSSSSTSLLPSPALKAIPTKNETSSEIRENPKECPTGPRIGPASSPMTSSAPSNKNFPGIVSTASQIISHSSFFICSGHCHHDHYHHHHHYNHYSHRHHHHHQDQTSHHHQPQQDGLHFVINPSPPDFQSSGVTTPSDVPDLSNGVNWFLRLARGLLTEKFSQKEFCSAFDHTKLSVADVTDCLDLSTLTFLTRVKIKKVCSLSSQTSVSEYLHQKSTFINEALLNSEVQDDVLPERKFNGFLEMTETMDLVSYNVDPSSNSSAYNIVLNSQNIFVISRGSKPWFGQKLTLWLAAVTVLSWPLRILLGLRTQTVCHFVVKSFGTKEKSDLVDKVTSHSYRSCSKTEMLQTPAEKLETRENGFKATYDGTGACNSPPMLCNDLSMHRKATMSKSNDSKEHHVADVKRTRKLSGVRKTDAEEIPPSYEEVLNCGITGRCLCDCHKQSSQRVTHPYKPQEDQDDSKVSAVPNRSVINGEKPLMALGRQMKPMRNGRRIFGRLFQKKVHHVPRTKIVQFMETSL